MIELEIAYNPLKIIKEKSVAILIKVSSTRSYYNCYAIRNF